jgi:hypothetical protein
MGTDIQIATYLLEHGADPFFSDKNMETPYEYFSKLAYEYDEDEEEYKPDFRSILALFDQHSRRQ